MGNRPHGYAYRHRYDEAPHKEKRSCEHRRLVISPFPTALEGPQRGPPTPRRRMFCTNHVKRRPGGTPKPRTYADYSPTHEAHARFYTTAAETTSCTNHLVTPLSPPQTPPETPPGWDTQPEANPEADQDVKNRQGTSVVLEAGAIIAPAFIVRQPPVAPNSPEVDTPPKPIRPGISLFCPDLAGHAALCEAAVLCGVDWFVG